MTDEGLIPSSALPSSHAELNNCIINAAHIHVSIHVDLGSDHRIIVTVICDGDNAKVKNRIS